MEVHTFTGSQNTVDRLNAASVEGIEILSAKVLPKEAGNAMASVAAAGYTVSFREGREPAFDWKECLPAFYAKKTIPVRKETKKSIVEMDLKPGIFRMEITGDSIYMLLDASSSGNIKPGMVMEAFLAQHQDTLKENALCIIREDTYTNIGTADAPEFVPLDAIGKECSQEETAEEESAG